MTSLHSSRTKEVGNQSRHTLAGMNHFSHTVTAITEESFQDFSSLPFAEIVESLGFHLGTLFPESRLTYTAMANALVDAGVADNEDDGANQIVDNYRHRALLQSCADAKLMLQSIGITTRKPAMAGDDEWSGDYEEPALTRSYEALDNMTAFHQRRFDALLNGPAYLSNDAQNAMSDLFRLIGNNDDLRGLVIYQFIEGMQA